MILCAVILFWLGRWQHKDSLYNNDTYLCRPHNMAFAMNGMNRSHHLINAWRFMTSETWWNLDELNNRMPWLLLYHYVLVPVSLPAYHYPCNFFKSLKYIYICLSPWANNFIWHICVHYQSLHVEGSYEQHCNCDAVFL